ncbi:uncharacterized protein LOC125507416 [Triticum urartu]|uniref:uncharacterized protein LOC125507416 n=1 Tax=Triticum urartu TaxID=4572 RepID=UPI002042FF50|nr:uncharacterized protein LOC125507416 [Triticum urartu]
MDHALMDGRDPNARCLTLTMPNWHWQSLQPPPFPSRLQQQRPYLSEIRAYTAVGDQLWVSTVDDGTFCFDTESGAWSNARRWALPFRGRAEYVPEHRLWIGFSDTGGQQELCASDLALAAVSARRPPVWQNLGSDLGLRFWPKDWQLMSTDLVPLGSGRLCTARFFLTEDEDKSEDMFCHTPPPDISNNFMVLVGVEVVSDEEGRLRMIRHKFQRYTFGRDRAFPM